jgi:CysZ protein
VIGIFADEVVEAVERATTPHAGGRNVPLGRSLRLSLASVGRLLLWNLLAAPFYLILLVTGIGPFLLFSAGQRPRAWAATWARWSPPATTRART